MKAFVSIIVHLVANKCDPILGTERHPQRPLDEEATATALKAYQLPV